MDLADDLFLLGYLARFVVLVPLDPVPPHLDDLFLFELPGDAEPGGRVDVGVEVFLGGQLGVLLSEEVDHFLLVGLDLGELAVGDEEGVGCGLLHCCSIIKLN